MRRLFSTPRFWIGLFITIFWVVMMALMVMRSGLRPGGALRRMGVSSEVLMVSWTDYDHWVWVRSREKLLGLSHLAVHPATGFSAGLGPGDDAPAYEMESRTRLQFEMMGLTLPLDISMAGRMNTAFELQALQMMIRIADQKVLCQAFCEEGWLYYRIRIEPADRPLVLPAQTEDDASSASGQSLPLAGMLPLRDVCGRMLLAEPILMNSVLMPVITRSEKIEKGAKWTTRASDPVSGMLDLDVEITVQGKEEIKVDDLTYQAWKMTEKIGPVQSTVWYDPEGRLLRQDMSNGLRLLRANASEALTFDPEFRHRPAYPPLDQEWIRTHLEPDLTDQPLANLLPGLPVL